MQKRKINNNKDTMLFSLKTINLVKFMYTSQYQIILIKQTQLN